MLWSASFLAQPLTGNAQNNQILSLDGKSGQVSIPSAPDLQNPTEITIEAWIYPKPPKTQVNDNFGNFIAKSDGINYNTSRSYEVYWVTNSSTTGYGKGINVSLFLGTSTWAVRGASLVESNWVHVAATYASASGLFQFFTNGVLASAETIPGGPLLRQTDLPLNIGGQAISYGPEFAAGYMDEVRIWNKARTQAEIAGSMSCRLTGTEANLVGYWNFDDGTAKDLSGHGHNGALAGGAAIVPLSGDDLVHAACGSPLLDIRVSQVSICWDTASNKTYQLQYRSDLTTNQWVNLGGLLPGTGSKICITDEVTDSPRRFYRAVVP
jgi:hypothetical protein